MDARVDSNVDLVAATAALRDAIGRSLRDGRAATDLGAATNGYIEARRRAGSSTSVSEMLINAFSIVMQYEQSERQYRDPYSRGVGDADPVLCIANCCIDACCASTGRARLPLAS